MTGVPALGAVIEKLWEKYNSLEARFARIVCDELELGRPHNLEAMMGPKPFNTPHINTCGK